MSLEEWAEKARKAREEWARKIGSFEITSTWKVVRKPWGHEFILGNYLEWTIKILHVGEGKRTSLQYHERKVEVMFYIDGSFEVIAPRVIHRLVGPVDVLEVSMGSDEDVVRLEDDYGRENMDD